MQFAKRLEKELSFRASRSGGPGGQNVNKVNSKVTLKFDLANSIILTTEEKETLLVKLASSLSRDGVLVLSADSSRSQLDNKEAVVAKFERLMTRAFEKKKKRVATKPSKASAQKRIDKKKRQSEKKKWRQKL